MTFLQRYFHRPQQVAVRRLNFQVHLWVGIILTLYMIVIGVSGSISSVSSRVGEPVRLEALATNPD